MNGEMIFVKWWQNKNILIFVNDSTKRFDIDVMTKCNVEKETWVQNNNVLNASMFEFTNHSLGMNTKI